MDPYVKQEVALDILMSRIAKTLEKLKEKEDEKNREELNLLIKARDMVYSGDDKIMDRIINGKSGEE